jgi:hypothetical protein
VTKEEHDVVEFVLRFEIEQQWRVSVLLEDRRGNERRLKTMRLPMQDRAPKRSKRLAVPFPIIGKRSEKLLNLPRRPKSLNEAPLFRSKLCPAGGRRQRLL